MAIREIRVVPDPVLRTPCDEIKEITPAVRRLVTTCWKPWTIRAEPASPPTRSA